MVSERLVNVAAPLPTTLTTERRATPCVAVLMRTQTHLHNLLCNESRHEVPGYLIRSRNYSAYATKTSEDQSIGKVLTGYQDPPQPCITPTITTIAELVSGLEYAKLLTLRNVSGFADVTFNVEGMVLDAALASLRICLEGVAMTVQ
ncbi:LOW QUALITY PROTEIN: hypothetical protein PHMEG_0008118 [Phytophthora megakarya]|uniref:Uncharacterized protein n=1 Tax=Phytophthora megakarya TaxID=4795 RepID=A0A225WKV9_9STRA|nr:LOW QUALITY PROTEIN: hypothetical protein PHMEG_0008118 [Phytophthora megakarya]